MNKKILENTQVHIAWIIQYHMAWGEEQEIDGWYYALYLAEVILCHHLALFYVPVKQSAKILAGISVPCYSEISMCTF